MQTIADQVTAAGARFVDAGIIGLNPDSGKATSFYASGPEAEALKVIALEGRISVTAVGPEIGQASGLKMCYAALTKGTDTLRVAILLTARELGLYYPLLAEFEHSQASKLASMRSRPADPGLRFGALGARDGGDRPDLRGGRHHRQVPRGRGLRPPRPGGLTPGRGNPARRPTVTGR